MLIPLHLSFCCPNRALGKVVQAIARIGVALVLLLICPMLALIVFVLLFLRLLSSIALLFVVRFIVVPSLYIAVVVVIIARDTL